MKYINTICNFCGKEIVRDVPIEIWTSRKNKITICRKCYAERLKMGRYNTEALRVALDNTNNKKGE